MAQDRASLYASYHCGIGVICMDCVDIISDMVQREKQAVLFCTAAV
jgi:hypothetical protein